MVNDYQTWLCFNIAAFLCSLFDKFAFYVQLFSPLSFILCIKLLSISFWKNWRGINYRIWFVTLELLVLAFFVIMFFLCFRFNHEITFFLSYFYIKLLLRRRRESGFWWRYQFNLCLSLFAILFLDSWGLLMAFKSLWDETPVLDWRFVWFKQGSFVEDVEILWKNKNSSKTF